MKNIRDANGKELAVVLGLFGGGVMFIPVQSVLAKLTVMFLLFAYPIYFVSNFFNLIKNKKIRLFVSLMPFLICLVVLAISLRPHNEVAQKAIPTQEEDKSNNLIKNGDFERDFRNWESFGSLMPKSISAIFEKNIRVSADAAIVEKINTADGNIFSIENQYGRNNTRCLLIENSQKTTPDSYGGIKQHINGLNPKTKYQLRFYAKGSINSKQSLWFIIGDTWNFEGRFYKIPSDKNEYPDWTEFKAILTTGDWHEADFLLVSDDKSHLLRVDDISLIELE